MNRRKFIKKTLEGIVIAGSIGSIPLISGCVHNPFGSERETIGEKGLHSSPCLPSSPYLPFNIGNSWTYVNIKDGSTKTFNIIGTEKINGETYCKFDDYFRVPGFPGWHDGINLFLFRYDSESDKVLQYWLGKNKDVVRYDFNVKEGETKGDMWGNYGNQLILTGLSNTVPAGKYNNCFKFHFAMLIDCGVYYETLAPNVGVIINTQLEQLQNYKIVK